MQRLRQTVSTFADTDARVLILGEPGTGKELVAQALHSGSRRGREREPFVSINCSAIPETLMESELFGHEKGSFTGAYTSRLGLFERAGAGTLFLDEVGELPIELQSKLLRVLQTGEFTRVGGSKTLRTEARVIAATNKDVRLEVQARRFRADLFHRLSVLVITTPTLEDHPEDIPALASAYLDSLGGGFSFTPEALRSLQDRSWTGNVRELQNVIERTYVLSRSALKGTGSTLIGDTHLQEALQLGMSYRQSVPVGLSDTEQVCIRLDRMLSLLETLVRESVVPVSLPAVESQSQVEVKAEAKVEAKAEDEVLDVEVERTWPGRGTSVMHADGRRAELISLEGELAFVRVGQDEDLWACKDLHFSLAS